MGFHGWVGLNTALYSDYVEINPFVGIHSIEIERLWTSLKGSIKKTRYDRAVSTYAVHFSAILPQINSFKFYSASDITVKAEELAKLYAIDGIEFSKSLSSYEVLRDRLYERVPLLGAYPERYACCLLLLEQKAQASEFVASFVKKNPNYFPNFDQVFGKFIEGNIMREFVG